MMPVIYLTIMQCVMPKTLSYSEDTSLQKLQLDTRHRCETAHLALGALEC